MPLMSLKKKIKLTSALKKLRGKEFPEVRLFNEFARKIEKFPLQGPKGDKGEAGNNGRDGIGGIDGKNGNDGKDGRDGQDGVAGESINLDDVLSILRPELYSKIYSLIPHGGGNANRNIAISGNTSVLSRYTDINLRPGAGVSFTYSNNDTTKYFDLTIASSGVELTKSISTLSVSSTIGVIASTDQVFICSQGIQVTLPTAVGDTSQYTIKNTAVSSILVSTTGGQTIDGESTTTLLTQYTAIDVVSDGTNWSLT